MTIPNLDAMTSADLWAFHTKYQRGSKRSDCAALLGSKFHGYTVIAADLSAYAANKATAQDCRERGDIESALMYEGICERIYNDLPAPARW